MDILEQYPTVGNQMNEQVIWCCLPLYADFYNYCCSKLVNTVMPLFIFSRQGSCCCMEASRKACWIQGWNLNGGFKVKWKSSWKYLEICVLFLLSGGGPVFLCCSQLGWACCRPTVLAALVHITLASTNQSHELSCSEMWLLDEYEYPCFSFSK